MKKKTNSQKKQEKKDDKKKTCFIVMPLTVPKPLLRSYQNDKNHFRHVIDHLFIPALEQSNFKPILPIAQGAEVIHGEIIENLVTADIVLCDMTSLNANVFFEFGIRTSLNRPVSLVRDNITLDIPFDTTIINYHTYKYSLRPWELEEEIKLLSKYVLDCFKKSKGINSLWKYFGISKTAQPPEEKDSMKDKLDYLLLQFESLRDKITEKEKYEIPYMPLGSKYYEAPSTLTPSSWMTNMSYQHPSETSYFSEEERINTAARVLGISDSRVNMRIDGGYTLSTKRKIKKETRDWLIQLMKEWGIDLHIIEE